MRLSALPQSAPAMRRSLAAALLACGLVAFLLLWLGGGFAAIGHWALEQQRGLQALLGSHLQEIRAGRAAFWGLLALAAGYGFVHAVGPGHGKVLVTGAALGTRISLPRMVAIALAGSLAQAGFAILLVYGGFLIFDATARAAIGLEAALEPVGHLAVALVGAWLVSRGLWAWRHPSGCGCGHAHGPDPVAASRAGIGQAAALVAAMAARPCAGALIVLVLAWRMDLALLGAGAALAMGLGTAAFTCLVAALAVTGRESAFLSFPGGRAARRLAPALQIGAGCLILAVSGALLCAALAT